MQTAKQVQTTVAPANAGAESRTRKPRNSMPTGLTAIAQAAWAEERLLKLKLSGSLKVKAIEKETADSCDAVLAGLSAEAREKLGK
jgi:hypothetical protein